MKNIVLCIVLLMINTATAKACSCVRSKIDIAQFIETQLVFTAKSIDVKLLNNAANEKQVTLQINKIYKGFSVETKEIKMITGTGNGDCSLPIKPDEEWVIWGWLENGIVKSNFCTRSMLLKNATAELKFLNKLILHQETWKVGKKRIAKGAFIDGYPNGPWKYFRDGKLASEGNYLKGNRVGIWNSYITKPDGTKLVATNDYNRGEHIVSSRIYFKNGNLEREIKNVDTAEVYDKVMIYWRSGKLREQVRKISFNKSIIKYYHENGQLAYSEEIKSTDANPFGKVILMYGEDGKQISSDDYSIEFDKKKNKYIFKKTKI